MSLKSLAATVGKASSYLQERFGTQATKIDREQFEEQFAADTEKMKDKTVHQIAFGSADFFPTPENIEILKRGGYTEAAIKEEANKIRAERVAELLLAGVGHEAAFAAWRPLNERAKSLKKEGHNPDSPVLIEAERKAAAAHKAQRLLHEPRTLGLCYLRLPYESEIRAQKRTIATAEQELNQIGAAIQRASATIADGSVTQVARLEALQAIDSLNKHAPKWENKRAAAFARIAKIEAEQAAAEKDALADAEKRAAAKPTKAKPTKATKATKAGL